MTWFDNCKQSIIAGNLIAFGELMSRSLANDINSVVDGKTLLSLAAKAANIDIIALLLKNGADVNVKDGDGRTPIYSAIESDNFEVVKLLFENGAHVTNDSPLYLAQQLRHGDMVDLFSCLYCKTGKNDDVKPKYTITNIVFDCENITDLFFTYDNLHGVDLTKVVTICERAFESCRQLTYVKFGEGLVSIGESAFASTNITPLPQFLDGIWSESGTFIADSAGRAGGDDGEEHMQHAIHIPKSVQSIGKFAFFNCPSLRQVVFEAGSKLQTISAHTFLDCGLTDIVIPDSVATIGDAAFGRCLSLTNVTFGKGVRAIERDAFFGCSSFTSVILPDIIKTIGESAFAFCNKLTHVTINGNVGKYAFYKCTSLTNVVIAASVKRIEANAFYECAALNTVCINGNPTILTPFYVETAITPIESIGKFNASTLKNVTILKSANTSVTFDCVGFTGNLTFSNGIKQVTLKNGSSMLKTVRLPASCNQFTTTADIETLCISSRCVFNSFDRIKSSILVVKPETTSFVRVGWTDFTRALHFEDGIEAIYFEDTVYQLSSLRIPESCKVVHVGKNTLFPELQSDCYKAISTIMAKSIDN
jgi:hypothetical protein